MTTRIATIVLALTVVVGACGDDTSVFDLAVGDCFDDPPSVADEVEAVTTVDCTQPHDNEIYFEYQMTEAVYPGREETMNLAATRCLAEFEPFVGMPYADSDLDLFPITPTAESWENGDRVVYCAIYALDLSKLTGSMRGAAR
ncbi:MAG: septum formation family protein [Acidimicrobiia bacterium]|nr:MAG: septum formation family protein [Acidimicrobiia bacterium]